MGEKNSNVFRMLLPTLNIVTLEKVEKLHYLLNYFFTSSMRDIVLSEIVQNFINDIESIYKKVVNMYGTTYHKLFRCNLITSDPNVQDATCTQSALDVTPETVDTIHGIILRYGRIKIHEVIENTKCASCVYPNTDRGLERHARNSWYM